MSKYLQATSNTDIPAFQKIDGHDAAQIIMSASFNDDVGFDTVEAQRLGLELGQMISVAPDDTGKRRFLDSQSAGFIILSTLGKKHPTIGKLVAINREEVVVEVRGSSGSPVRCHLPRLNFTVRTEKAKL